MISVSFLSYHADNFCGIHWSQETLVLHPKSYASSVDGGAASVIVVQTQMGVTALIAMNACEEAFPWWHLFSLSSMVLLAGDVFPPIDGHVHHPHLPFADVLEMKMRSPSCPLAGDQFTITLSAQKQGFLRLTKNPPIQHIPKPASKSQVKIQSFDYTAVGFPVTGVGSS